VIWNFFGGENMMAGLFAIFSVAIALILMRMRLLAMYVIVAGILCSLLMFWHHATDILKINW
jgi:hypothetical protein